MPSSMGSSRARSPTHASCSSSIAGGCFTTEPLGRPKFHIWHYICFKCTTEWFHIFKHYELNCYDKFDYHVWLQRFLTRLLTIFPVCTFHSHDLFYNWKFVSPNAFPVLHISLLPPPLVTMFVLYVSESISVLFPVFSYFISEVTHVNKTVCYLSFSVCLVLLGITPSRSIHVVDNDKICFFFFNCWVIFHCVWGGGVCTISSFLTHLSMGT